MLVDICLGFRWLVWAYHNLNETLENKDKDHGLLVWFLTWFCFCFYHYFAIYFTCSIGDFFCPLSFIFWWDLQCKCISIFGIRVTKKRWCWLVIWSLLYVSIKTIIRINLLFVIVAGRGIWLPYHYKILLFLTSKEKSYEKYCNNKCVFTLIDMIPSKFL